MLRIPQSVNLGRKIGGAIKGAGDRTAEFPDWMKRNVAFDEKMLRRRRAFLT
jgi:hypothetical protein